LLFNPFRSFVGRSPAPGLDGAIVAALTILALFYCYEFEVFPSDSKPYTLELDELLFVSTLFFGGLFLCALRRLVRRESQGAPFDAPLGLARGQQAFSPILTDKLQAKWHGADIGKPPVGLGPLGRPSKNVEIQAAIEALAAESVELPKLSRKDACARIRQKATELGANVEVGFSNPVIQRSLVRRYGPRI
jgi:hypothetical protein